MFWVLTLVIFLFVSRGLAGLYHQDFVYLNAIARHCQRHHLGRPTIAWTLDRAGFPGEDALRICQPNQTSQQCNYYCTKGGSLGSLRGVLKGQVSVNVTHLVLLAGSDVSHVLEDVKVITESHNVTVFLGVESTLIGQVSFLQREFGKQEYISVGAVCPSEMGRHYNTSDLIFYVNSDPEECSDKNAVGLAASKPRLYQGPVEHVTSTAGKYEILNWAEARTTCSSRGLRLATREQLETAWKDGMDVCACGWLADGSAAYLSSSCGSSGPAGVRTCTEPEAGKGWDAYCMNTPILVVHVQKRGGSYEIPSWKAAAKQCANQDMRLATRDQLTEAWRQGLDVCACGWLADGSVGYPILKPRDGCGNSAAGIRTCTRIPFNVGWDTYCTKAKLSVVHVTDDAGSYKIATLEDANSKCTSRGMRLATRDQLTQAWKQGLDVCSCGWLADGSVGYPITRPRDGCGGAPAGVRSCSSSIGGGAGWDVYCTNIDLPVVHLKGDRGPYTIADWSSAGELCARLGMRLATREQLTEAWEQGLDVCSCGWLADGSVGYPILRPRSGCGGSSARIRTCSGTPSGVGWDAYCTKSSLPVVHVKDDGGSYRIPNVAAAASKCASKGMRLATRDQLADAWKLGLDKCLCGWLADGSVGYPNWVPRSGCGDSAPGIRTCPSTPSGSGWDAYCTKSELPVAWVTEKGGSYKIQNASDAAAVCAGVGMRLATYDQLTEAWKQGMDNCHCGWLADGSSGYPILRQRTGCGTGEAGIRICSGTPRDGWDAYCTNSEVPVVYLTDKTGSHKIKTWESAAILCISRGMRLATRDQLREAWGQGLDVCACGWLADGTVGYPIWRPRTGCGENAPAGIRECTTNPPDDGWDAYCTKSKLPVIHIANETGTYQIPNVAAAATLCADRGMRLATFDQLLDAWKQGFDQCACGWLADGQVGYPILKPREGCGSPAAGVKTCSKPNGGTGWDAYCTDIELPVFHVVSNEGENKIPTLAAAATECASRGMRLATRDQLQEAWALGMDVCSCGWLADGTAGFPIMRSRDGCGGATSTPGLRKCHVYRSGVHEYDAFCTKKELPVVRIAAAAGGHKIPSWEAAVKECADRGMRLATPDQLEDARLQGFDACYCGWLGDGTAGYPILRPRNGCGLHRAGIRVCPSRIPSGAGWDAYCIKTDVPVVHLIDKAGRYKIPTWAAAVSKCASEGMRLATRDQLEEARKLGFDACACGWTADGSVMYPIVRPRDGCGVGAAGTRICTTPPNPGWDAYCTKAKLPVVHITNSSGNHMIKTWDAAVRLCATRGMRLATRDQLNAARLQGLDVCFCGWLADGTVGYPVVKPREGCGTGSGRPEIASCSSTPPRDAGYDAYCTNSKIPVVHVEDSAKGSHQIPTREHAKHQCAVRGMKLASRAQLTAAWKQGLDVCACGWLDDGTVGFPIVKQRDRCGPPGKPYGAGVRTCSNDPTSAGNPGWDAYCTATERGTKKDT